VSLLGEMILIQFDFCLLFRRQAEIKLSLEQAIFPEKMCRKLDGAGFP